MARVMGGLSVVGDADSGASVAGKKSSLSTAFSIIRTARARALGGNADKVAALATRTRALRRSEPIAVSSRRARTRARDNPMASARIQRSKPGGIPSPQFSGPRTTGRPSRWSRVGAAVVIGVTTWSKDQRSPAAISRRSRRKAKASNTNQSSCEIMKTAWSLRGKHQRAKR